MSIRVEKPKRFYSLDVCGQEMLMTRTDQIILTIMIIIWIRQQRNQRNFIFLIPTQDDGGQRARRYGKHRLLSSAFLLTGCVSNWSLLHLFHHSCILYRMMRNMKQKVFCMYCILIFIFICVNILDRQPTSWSRAWQTTVHHPIGRCFSKVRIREPLSAKLFWAQRLSVEENSAKKQVFRSKNSIFCLFFMHF